MDSPEDLLAAYDRQLRPAEALGLRPGLTLEHDGPLTRIIGPPRGFISPPVDLGTDGGAIDELIVRQRDYFAARGESVEWKWRGHDRPADLPERLVAAGFAPEEEETVLIGPAADLVRHDLVAPAGVGLRRTTADDDLDRIGRLQSEVWAEDAGYLAEDLRRRLRDGRERLAVFVAEAQPGARPDREGPLVAAAWISAVADTPFAGLWGGSTLAAWRGRGVYRALVGLRARLAVEWGVRYLQVDASSDSRPILERLGFVAVTTATPFVFTAPGTAPDADSPRK